MAEAKQPTKVFDVSKPGKTAPSSSSKPIIITNRPVLKDPMMVDDTPPAAKTETLAPSASRVKIVPLSHDEDDKITVSTGKKDKPAAKEPKKDSLTVDELSQRLAAKKSVTVEAPEADAKEAAKEPAKSEVKPAAPKAAKAPATKKVAVSTNSETTMPPRAEPEPSPEPAAKPDPEPEPTAIPEPKPVKPASDPEPEKPQEETAAEPETSDNTDGDEPTSSDDRDKPKDGTKADDANLAAQKEQERAAELAKLAESHKYYLPINQIERRRNKRVAWLGLAVVVILGLAWADVALDAGLVTIPGVKPPTHFFSK